MQEPEGLLEQKASARKSKPTWSCPKCGKSFTRSDVVHRHLKKRLCERAKETSNAELESDLGKDE